MSLKGAPLPLFNHLLITLYVLSDEYNTVKQWIEETPLLYSAELMMITLDAIYIENICKNKSQLIKN